MFVNLVIADKTTADIAIGLWSVCSSHTNPKKKKIKIVPGKAREKIYQRYCVYST